MTESMKRAVERRARIAAAELAGPTMTREMMYAIQQLRPAKRFTPIARLSSQRTENGKTNGVPTAGWRNRQAITDAAAETLVRVGSADVWVAALAPLGRAERSEAREAAREKLRKLGKRTMKSGRVAAAQ